MGLEISWLVMSGQARPDIQVPSWPVAISPTGALPPRRRKGTAAPPGYEAQKPE
jgi:hypothetical protein